MKREEVISILRSHRADLENRGVKSLALFGSTARGDSRPDSDVDLLVDFSVALGLFEFIELEQYLERLLGCPVDLGTPGALKPRIRQQVLQEAVYVS